MAGTFTTKGRIRLLRDGVLLSEHTVETEAIERAWADFDAHGDGLYTFEFPRKELMARRPRITTVPAPDPTLAPPSAPLLSHSETTVGTAVLTWSPATPASGTTVASYRVYQNGSLIQSGITGLTHSVSGLSEGTLYQFHVVAVSNYGVASQASNTANVSWPSWTDALGDSFTVNASTAFSYTLTAADLDGDTIQFDYSNVPVGVSVAPQQQSGTTRSIIVSSSGLAAGSYSVGIALTVGGEARSITFTVQAASNAVIPAVYPLELVSPRASGTLPSADVGTPAMPSGHRIFKAYPGIPYNIRAAVVGGSYPYTFVLSNAPSGMTINARTGEINWPNPTSDATPTITVTDSEGTQRSSSWTITVTTSGFMFYDAVNGNNGNPGTLASPRRTLGHARANTANQIVYFRAGTYSMSDFSSLGYAGPYGTGHLKCGWGPGRGSSVQMLAYPGESVTFDHAYSTGVYAGVMLELEPSAYSASAQPMYLDGITFSNVSNCLLRPTANGSYHHIRRCTFTQIWAPVGGDNPAGIMWTANPIGGPYRHYVTLQDNTGTDLDNGQTCGVYKFYTLKKMLVEDDSAYACGMAFDIKQDCPRFEVRGGWYRDNIYQQPGIVGNQHANCSGEIRYNRVTSRASSVGVNNAPALAVNNFSDSQRIDVYRNTFVGQVWIEGSSGTGPFVFKRNVIINNNTTYSDRLSYTNYGATSGLVQLGTGNDANLVGGIGSGIVNESGDLSLTGTSAQYVGQIGHQIP